MEFQLNKIDTSIRRELQEKTSDDKVHRKSKARIEIDAEREEKHKEDKKDNNFKDKLNQAKKIKVHATKNENKVKVVVKSKLEAQTDRLGISEGLFIDTRK